MPDKSAKKNQVLVEELDQLMHLLGEESEFRHEIPMSHPELEGIEPAAALDRVPVLTSIYDSETSAESVQLDALIEELIEALMPRFETLLRARLKARLKTQRK